MIQCFQLADPGRTLVGARSLDVPRLFAFVANSFRAWLGWAVATQMSYLATFDMSVRSDSQLVKQELTVVALLSMSAIAGHVSKTAAGVAGLLRAPSAVSSAVATALVTAAIAATTTFIAVASNVADFPTLVTFLTAAHTTAAGIATWSS